MKAIIVLAALVCLSQFAAAQQGPARGQAGPAQQLASPAPPRKGLPPMPEPTECDTQLATIAVARPEGSLSGPGECGAPDAVLLQGVMLADGATVAVTPPATLRCTMAQTVAHWLREAVAPAAAKLGSPLRGLENLDSYECRTRDRVPGAKLSEHGRANALDVGSFKLASGKILALADPQVSKDFREAVRAGACARFMTVLGPGSDSDHAAHVHIDLAERRNNYRICEWNVSGPVAQAAATPLPSDDVPLPRARPLVANFGLRLR